MNITILGCGVYGSDIASVLLENKTNVTMWNKFEKEINELKNKYNSINFTTNIEKAIEEVKSKGYKMIDETPRYGAGGAKIAFCHPKGIDGVLLELSERK